MVSIISRHGIVGSPLEYRGVFLHSVLMSGEEFPNQQPGAFDLQPHLVGDLLEVRPLLPEDWESLFAVASDPLIWEQHPAPDRYTKEVFKDFFRGGLESGGAFIVIDRKTQRIIGSSRF